MGNFKIDREKWENKIDSETRARQKISFCKKPT